MNRIITLNISEKDNYNEYRLGNIVLAKQTDFLHYFWLGISLCHEVISISKNKQTLKKKHYDDIFVYHEDSKKKTNMSKKRTFNKSLK